MGIIRHHIMIKVDLSETHLSDLSNLLTLCLLSAPAAMGEEAEVPVWEEVQRPCRSVVITFLSPCLQKIFYLLENYCKNIGLQVKNIFG